MKKTPLILTGGLLLSCLLWNREDDALPVSPQPVVKVREQMASSAVNLQDAGPQTATDFGSEVLKAKKAPDFKPLHAFREWEQRYMAATPEERAAMKDEGVALAAARRPEMKKLIVQNPKLALEIAVRPVVRQDLPAEVVEQLEKPVSKKGDYKAYFGRPQDGVTLPEDAELVLRYFETPEGDSFKANVFGAMQEAVSRKEVPIRGVAIDRELAVAENPLRQLEAGERIAAGTPIDETCPVSGETTPTSTETQIEVEEETPVVELAGRFIRLCNGTHVQVFGESQLWASGGPGGAGYFYDNHPGTSSEAIGNFRCLYIRVTYPDQMRAPNTEARAYDDMRNVSRYYLESSYGKLTTTSVVTPLIVMPHTKAWYIAKDSEVDGLGLVHSHARAEARKLGYDNSQFNCTIVRVNEGPRLSGISWGGGDSVWVSWDGMDVLNHECGHSLGRNHANFWSTSDGSAIGVGSNQEYGNSFDVMGGGGGFGAHYNSYSKRSLGWLQDPYIHRPGTTTAHNGVYRIYAYDQPRVEEGKRYSLRVDKDAQRRFYLEYHPAIGGNWPNQMLMIMSGLGSNAGHLVDTTPGSDGGKGDGGIQIGRTFSDFESDLHFTVLSKNGTTPESLDLAMMRGPFPGNLPPVIAGITAPTTVATNGSVTFTASASDPNGDTLAYHWDFSDGYVAGNAPVITRQFTSTDQQTICLTVSDMKGGTARAHSYLTIGNPGRVLASGRITHNGQPLAGVRVTSDTDKYCFTDSNGDYVIADLQTGSRTLTASLTGYTFTPGFANPFSATPAGNTPTVTGLNWTADSVPQITMTATDGAEGGASGSFVVTRTGDTTAELEVTVAPAGGSAVKTTDYTFSPDYTASGSMNTFTIPAGQSSLAVTVAPVNDTAQEGPETVTLQLAAGAYQVRTSGLASLTIADNDTTRPVVAIEATDIYATETAGDSGTFRISRTGSTAGALSVALTLSGTAGNGTDFTAMPATVSIPAGQSSAIITLTPTDDAAIETPEDATLTVVTNANYVVSPIASAATVTITDNDLPSVSLTVADDTLNEAGRGTGLVILTRTGSLASPLKAYYGLSGRALHGTDYAALPGEVTFPAGAESVPVVITPYDDDIGEIDESISFTLTTFDNAYTLGASFTANLTIKDNADAPLITVSANSAAEPSTNGTFTFTALGSVSGNITVNYTISGTASGGSDFTMPSGSVSIAGTAPDGRGSSATVSIPVVNDALPENTETVILTITPGAAYKVYNDGVAVMRLKDDDSEVVTVSAHSSGLAEPADDSSFYIARAGTAGALTVSYTMSGTAVNGTDYTLLSGSAVIPDGETGVDVTIAPIDDTLREGTETVVMTVNPTAAYGLDVPQATLYLNDSDLSSSFASVGFVSTAGTTSEAPDATTGEFRDIEVTVPSGMTGTITVDYVMRGGTATGDDIDWSFANAANGNAFINSGTLTFPPGTLSRFVRVRVRNDGIIEGSETAIIDLVNLTVGGSSVRLSGSRYRHTLTITDNAAANPAPRVSFIAAATTRQEADGSEPLLIAALDVPSASPVTVNYTASGTATAGSDYTLAAGPLTFAAGETFKKLPLNLISDGVTELSETIAVTLTSPTGATMGTIPTHTITVADVNVAAVNVSATPLNVEEDSNQAAAFTITRSGGATSFPLAVNYTVAGTASAGTDYPALSGTVILPANQTSIVLNVTATPDFDQEGDETIIVTINDTADYNPGANAEATVTILEDDALPVLSFVTPAAASVAIPAGTGLIAEVNATRELPSGTVFAPVTWSQVSGPGGLTFESPSNRRTAITFSAAGTYVLRASSTHGTTVDADVTVSVVGTEVTQSFSATRFGNAPATAGLTKTGGTYNLTVGGSSIPSTGTADQFLFAQQPISGDCSITARVLSIATGGSNTSDNRSGVMIRESLTEGGSLHAFMGITKSPGSRFITRATPAAASTNNSGTGGFPMWVRLTRTGNSFKGETAPDVSGVPGAWTLVGTRTIAMNTAAFIGIAGASGSSSGGTTAAVVVDNVKILPYAPVANLGPAVDAGAALSGAGPWNLNASVTDDGLPLPASLTTEWKSVSGPSVPAFQNGGAVDTGVFFTAAGSYRLRLCADDGQVKTFDDTTATIVTQTPIESWRAAEFGVSATNPAIAGDLVDHDKDGLTNLVEYALASNPNASVGAHLPVSENNGATITLTYRLNLDATDVTVQLESSPDMVNWANAPATLSTVSDDGHVRVIAATVPATAGRRFLRLNVTWQPPVNPWRRD